jgi:hypothetical protein
MLFSAFFFNPSLLGADSAYAISWTDFTVAINIGQKSIVLIKLDCLNIGEIIQ